MTKQITEQEYNQLKEETRDFIKTMLAVPDDLKPELKGYAQGLMAFRINPYDPDERKAG